MPRWRHHGGGGPIPAMKGHLITVCHSGWGMVVVSTNGHRKLGQLRRGVVSIVPEGTDGHFDITGESECSQVIVPSTLLVERGVEAGMTERVALQQQTTVPDPVLYQLVDMLSRDDKSCSVSERFREQCAALICTHLLIRYTKRAAPDVSASSSGLASWQLRRIKKYVLENLQLRLTLQDLAKEVALSRHYLCTAFRAATGFTPQEYVTSVRIERAKQLLAESRLSIGDIAASVGYRTASAFTACFRKATGVTPRHFRAAA